MRPYKFLLDRDVSKAVALFPARLAQDAKDRVIVKKAWDLRAILVTANGDDFVREVRAFLGQTKRKDCHDLFGLVVLPNKFEIQKRTLSDLAARLRLGGRKITWHDVWTENLCVRVKATGNPEITLLPRCSYCRKTGRE